MKHIFKKLHPNRSNETPQQQQQQQQQQPTTAAAPPPATPQSVQSPPCPSTSGSSAVNYDVASENNRLIQHQKDYYASEEEYQVQLALALSVSGQESTIFDPHKTPIRGGRGKDNANSDAESLSRRYWNYGVLDFEERLVDGFYDVYTFSSDPSIRENMPSLTDLENNNNGGSNYEVVIVNRKLDPALEELMQIAQCVALDKTEISVLIRRLAELVTEHLGGRVHDANIVSAKWMERSTELRTNLHTSVLPIGSLGVGLSRHRALLFKALADSVGIPCRLVKGSHYTGVEDDAVNIIKLQDSECLVDLMGDPGTLIPADLSSKDNSMKPYNPQLSKIPTFQTNTDTKVTYNKPVMPNETLSTSASTDNGVGSSGQNGKLPSANQAIGSSLYKPGRLPNLNVVPHNHKSNEASKNLFADLNPFQVKGVGKSNDVANEIEKLQLPNKPLMWKNRHAWNDVPKKNDNDVPEDLYNASVSSVVSRSSEVQPVKQTRLPFEDDFNFNVKEKEENEETLQLRGNNMKPRGTGGVSRPINLGSNLFDTMIDDVGDCEILWEDLVIGERIGLGSYGEVFHADWNGTEVAVKKFLDQDFSGAALDEFKREVRIMRRLRHPNVVLFMGAVTRPPNLSIVTEILPLGSLYRIIHRPNCQIDEKRRIKMALDVAKGMNCLHTSIPTIVHRDLKSHNLLVDNNWNVKVCDFGLSRLKHNTFLSSKSTGGTPEWMAPEVLRNEPSNEKCDVYSFGVILWELATLKLPWGEMNPMQVVGAVGFQNRRLDIPKEIDPIAARIILECWQYDQKLRPSFAQLAVALKSLQQLVVPSDENQPTAPDFSH